MIKIFPIQSGKKLEPAIYQGLEFSRDPNGFPLEDKTPNGLLTFMHLNHFGWEIDYSQAEADEELAVIEWRKIDAIARILRALNRGLPVVLFGKTYQISDKKLLRETAISIMDAIRDSRKIMNIARDDENGLVLEEIGYVI